MEESLWELAERLASPAPGPDRVLLLREAVARHVRPGDALHFGTTHYRAYASMCELARQFWGQGPRFTLILRGCYEVPIALLHGGLVERVITGYVGDIYPSPAPSPIAAPLILEGRVRVENWSMLTYVLRLMAGALGVGFLPTGSLAGSSMAEANAAGETFKELEDPFEPGRRRGAVRALQADLSFFHAAAADRSGNALFAPPYGEGFWGALGARRGVVLTCERLVSTEFIRRHSHLAGLPASRVLSVSEVPWGAHPGGMMVAGLPELEAYGEDYTFLLEFRAAEKARESFDAWVREWVLEPADRGDYLARLGPERLVFLRGKSREEAWRELLRPLLARAGAKGETRPLERMAAVAGRKVVERVRAAGYQTILAGVGVSNLAAWLGAALLREQGVPAELMAEIGFYGYLPRPGDPIVFNLANIPPCTLLTDALGILGVLATGAENRCLAVMGVGQVDRRGNINSTLIPGRAYLVGSGGGNDLASGAQELLLVGQQSARRFLEEVPYITSPGGRVSTLVSDLGVFEKRGGELVLTEYFPLPGEEREVSVRRIREKCGWDLEITPDLRPAPEPSRREVEILRLYDPEGFFLGA
ncbi:MAG: CoA-transferase [Nitrospinota bacterium]